MISDKVIQLKRFAFRATTFLLIFLVFDKVIGGIMHFLYFSQESKYTYGILETASDIVIVGSSRANHHYIPSIISDFTGLKCFNLGSGGEDIYYDYAVIKLIMESHTPRLIILDITDREFELRENNVKKFSELLPFYKTSYSIREIVKSSNLLERTRLLSALYPFNSQIANIFYSLIKKGNNPNLTMDGYIPLFGQVALSKVIYKRKQDVPLDYSKIDRVVEIAALCQRRNIKLLLVASPCYIDFKGEHLSLDILTDLVRVYGTEVWNYEQDINFTADKTLFKDELHLNHNGAVKYSKMIAGRIKNTNLDLN